MGGKPRPGHVRLSGGVEIPDPSIPQLDPDMVCARCHHVGMFIVPELPGRGLCVANCPKPWFCTKCDLEAAGEPAPPAHAPWCEVANPEAAIAGKGSL